MIAFFVSAGLLLEDKVDVLEHNTFYDGNGKVVFSQWIGWEYHGAERRVSWWTFGKNAQMRGHLVFIHEAEETTVVRFKVFLRSHTQYDPEVRDREFLPKSKRRGITRGPPCTK